ncbi:MAG: phytanoyl-CoA dioxygenase family protein [Planctomycetota bacterium]
MVEHRGRQEPREGVHPVGWLGDVIHADPRIFEMVRDLLGPDALPRHKIRGLYPVFPQPKLEPRRHGGMDAHPFQLSCVVYLSDVERDGGEFMVWPGSHRIMNEAFAGPYAWQLNEQQRKLRKKAEAKGPAVHLTGPAGTVILWHHRLLHGPNTNRGPGIRHALVGDFLRSDWQERAGETHDAGMWSGWAIDDRHLSWHRRLGAFGRRLLCGGAAAR